MTEDQTTKSLGIIKNLVEKSKSMREFAREIREDVSDICRWRAGKKSLTTRAVISICRLNQTIKPNDLNPDLFPEDLSFVFKTKGKS